MLCPVLGFEEPQVERLEKVGRTCLDKKEKEPKQELGDISPLWASSLEET